MKIIKFFSTSVVATALDMGVYTLLLGTLEPYCANMFSASLGMVANFVMQWFWVFRATRRWYVSFVFSAIFSVIGVFLSSLLVFLLTTKTLLEDAPLVAKCLVVVVIFFYNFLTKKFSFGD
ncbi:GtrA family protein [Desulfobulbus rhabdoformis]|uniref:GtrA family protein n=1 Tax=Desulfobulbus rhabdoformis TaxID=34032 RepID=UPI001965C2D9|nr:GtrA family protein [Desulfobulbus rhabdoformis]MBM9613258.1 GtrA family protein [Desulfobulbus rhabdoformis]